MAQHQALGHVLRRCTQFGTQFGDLGGVLEKVQIGATDAAQPGLQQHLTRPGHRHGSGFDDKRLIVKNRSAHHSPITISFEQSSPSAAQ